METGTFENTITIEDLCIQWTVLPDHTVKYRVHDSFDNKSETVVVPNEEDFNLAMTAFKNGDEAITPEQYKQAERALGSIRWIP